jgi:hypothetical protein
MAAPKIFSSDLFHRAALVIEVLVLQYQLDKRVNAGFGLCATTALDVCQLCGFAVWLSFQNNCHGNSQLSSHFRTEGHVAEEKPPAVAAKLAATAERVADAVLRNFSVETS